MNADGFCSPGAINWRRTLPINAARWRNLPARPGRTRHPIPPLAARFDALAPDIRALEALLDLEERHRTAARRARRRAQGCLLRLPMSRRLRMSRFRPWRR
ncbi:MAG: hypothetical protein HPM95_04185 [Alphaproteobacteria bacterium]|nr:hypothetical protein [Alphaproteobacteria bacterium]